MILRRKVGWSAVAAVVIVVTVSAASAVSPSEETEPVPVNSGLLVAADARGVVSGASVYGGKEAPSVPCEVATTGILLRLCVASMRVAAASGLERGVAGDSFLGPALGEGGLPAYEAPWNRPAAVGA